MKSLDLWIHHVLVVDLRTVTDHKIRRSDRQDPEATAMHRSNRLIAGEASYLGTEVFTDFFRTGEYFQVTTRRASRINSSPV